MNTRTPNADPADLDTLFQNEEELNQRFYENPSAVLRQVAGAALQRGRAEADQARAQEQTAASQEANWSKFWRDNPQISRADRAEVRRHLTEQFNGGDQELSNYTGDPEGAFDLMSERAASHLKELSRQRTEDEELAVFSPGGSGPADTGADPEEFRSTSSLSSMIRSRREAKRSRGRVA